jgi:hypothetical protein
MHLQYEDCEAVDSALNSADLLQSSRRSSIVVRFRIVIFFGSLPARRATSISDLRLSEKSEAS